MNKWIAMDGRSKGFFFIFGVLLFVLSAFPLACGGGEDNDENEPTNAYVPPNTGPSSLSQNSKQQIEDIIRGLLTPWNNYWVANTYDNIVPGNDCRALNELADCLGVNYCWSFATDNYGGSIDIYSQGVCLSDVAPDIPSLTVSLNKYELYVNFSYNAGEVDFISRQGMINLALNNFNGEANVKMIIYVSVDGRMSGWIIEDGDTGTGVIGGTISGLIEDAGAIAVAWE